MTLSIYLHYNGNCREAFEFYRSVFGGDFEMLSTFATAPPDMAVPEEERGNVMHVSYRIGSSVLMGSDVPSQFGPPPVIGGNFSISYTATSREEADGLFAKVAEGGTVVMPLADMFWGDYFGSCTDKFGVNWMFSYTAQQA